MMPRAFKQVDVFTATAYFGNPVAVVLDGSGLSDEALQRFAHWTNLSETTFLLPPSDSAKAAGADYRVRIFTPGTELPFAGHPTLGSCHAWLQAGGVPQSPSEIVQECQVGLVKIRRDRQRLAFAAPPLTRSEPTAAVLAQVADALGVKAKQILAAQTLDNGPVWLALLLDNPHTVLALKPNHMALKQLGHKVGVAAVAQSSAGSALIARSNREARAFGARTANPAAGADAADDAAADLVVRAFAAPIGIDEDPVTGSLNASLAQWLMAQGHLPARYVAAQGACLGRDGWVHIAQDPQGQVWVGGESVTCIDGQVNI